MVECSNPMCLFQHNLPLSSNTFELFDSSLKKSKEHGPLQHGLESVRWPQDENTHCHALLLSMQQLER